MPTILSRPNHEVEVCSFWDINDLEALDWGVLAFRKSVIEIDLVAMVNSVLFLYYSA